MDHVPGNDLSDVFTSIDIGNIYPHEGINISELEK